MTMRDAISVTGCPYDHSFPVCLKCGHHNEEAAHRELMAAARIEFAHYARRTANDASLSEDAYEHGFEAGYKHANEMLKNFFGLTGIKSPL